MRSGLPGPQNPKSSTMKTTTWHCSRNSAAFLCLGLSTGPSVDIPERVQDTIRTFPEKNGNTLARQFTPSQISGTLSTVPKKSAIFGAPSPHFESSPVIFHIFPHSRGVLCNLVRRTLRNLEKNCPISGQRKKRRNLVTSLAVMVFPVPINDETKNGSKETSPNNVTFPVA